MNIKYRLLCKRLIEERKRVGVIQYYNVLFIMELVSDKDIWSLEQWVKPAVDQIIIMFIIIAVAAGIAGLLYIFGTKTLLPDFQTKITSLISQWFDGH